MSTTLRAILAGAACCGMGAFIWALARAPEEPAPLRRRGGAWAANWPRNVPALERYVEEGTRPAGAWEELARRRRGSGDLVGAREAWKRTAEIAAEEAARRPDDPALAFLQGLASLETGDAAAAATAFRRAEGLYEAEAAASRVDAMTWQRLGWCRQRLGDESGAVEAWRRAAELTDRPSVEGLGPGGLYNLACFKALSGDREGALAAFDGAVEQGWRDWVWAEQDEDLDVLRGEERFRKAMAKMKAADGSAGVLTGG